MSLQVLSLIFPTVCLGCDVLVRHCPPGPLATCAACRPQLVKLPESERIVGDTAALYSYEGPIATALKRLKMSGDLALAGPLGRALAEAPELGSGEYDAVVPVPLHWRRRVQRGFDQTLLVCRWAGARRLAPQALARVRYGPAQAGLAAQRRPGNVRGAFAVPPRGAGLVEGRRILVVDDVVTTGATLGDCRRALLAAGAGSVRALALMRTLA